MTKAEKSKFLAFEQNKGVTNIFASREPKTQMSVPLPFDWFLYQKAKELFSQGKAITSVEEVRQEWLTYIGTFK